MTLRCNYSIEPMHAFSICICSLTHSYPSLWLEGSYMYWSLPFKKLPSAWRGKKDYEWQKGSTSHRVRKIWGRQNLLTATLFLCKCWERLKAGDNMCGRKWASITRKAVIDWETHLKAETSFYEYEEKEGNRTWVDNKCLSFCRFRNAKKQQRRDAKHWLLLPILRTWCSACKHETLVGL